jgi:hypothetical protein
VKILGFILVLLALFKVAWMIFLLWRGDTSHDSIWFLKQTVYALSFGIGGVCLLKLRKPEPKGTAPADTPPRLDRGNED